MSVLRFAATSLLAVIPLSVFAQVDETIVERGKRLELDTEYVPPPGDPNSHFTMGFARTLCSGVFVSGLDPDLVVKREVDFDNKVVHLTMENGVVRSAKYIGDLGCVPLPIGETDPYYEPPEITSVLPDPATTPWPMGDVLPNEPIPDEIDQDKLAAAVDAFFTDGAMSASFVVTYKGQIIAERYAAGIDMHTPLESWSMAKSLSATLMGVLIEQGAYELWQPAPIPEWQEEGDSRQKIRIADVLRMSSGLRCRNMGDPEWDPALGFPDHLYLYTGTVNSFEYAATRPQQWEPNTVGRYRNCDPVLVRDLVFQTDPYGNILLQGSDLGPARDWARLGNLYLNDGVVNGERILPEGFVDFVSTVAPAWEADGRPVYGGFFWLSGADYGLEPGEVFGMGGAGGQMTIIVPSKDMVVVRLGHYAGAPVWREARPKGMQLLMEAVPSN
jgi:CubicO group peptidase (beta-lactamase class C family)